MVVAVAVVVEWRRRIGQGRTRKPVPTVIFELLGVPVGGVS
jgi:hypothetical protein